MAFIRARFFTVCNFSGSQFLSDLGHDNGGIPGSNEKLAPECSYADTEVCYRLDEGLSSMWSTPYGTVTSTGTSTGISSVSVSISTFLTCACCTIITILFLFSSIYVRMLSARWLRIEIVRVKYKEADAGTADTRTGNGTGGRYYLWRSIKAPF